MRRALLTLIAVAALTGCDTQFTDPIIEQSAPTSCAPGYVAAFDGASAFGTATRLIQDDFTIEAWIRTPSSPSGASFANGSAIAFADVTTVVRDDFAMATLNDKLVFSTGGPDTAATGTSAVTSNQWVHAAVTRKRSNGVMLVYVNGVLEGSAVGNDHSLNQSPNITFGGRPGRNFFVGTMTDIRLWQTVRTQSQIAANMRHRLSGTEEGLVGYYRLDETTDPHARDSSPSVNDITFNGAITWVLSDLPLCAP